MDRHIHLLVKEAGTDGPRGIDVYNIADKKIATVWIDGLISYEQCDIFPAEMKDIIAVQENFSLFYNNLNLKE